MMDYSSISTYLSIPDILVTNERVPCKFLSDFPKMGFLDPSSAEDNLKAGTSLELPYWIVESFNRQPPVLSVDVPKVYKESYREILKADACAVDLHKLCLYFYEFGCYLAKYDFKGDVGATLMNTFGQRFRLMLEATSCDDNVGTATKVLQRLSAGELARAHRASAAVRALNNWLWSGVATLQTAHMVASHRKRKREEMELI